MNSYSGNGITSYRVSYQPAAIQTLKELHATLGNEDGARLTASLRTIAARMRSDPQVFGEHRYTLVHMRMAMRAGAIRPLHVTYGVNSEERLVFVYAFRLLPGRDSVSP
jgi:hypothetical protein